MRVGDSAHREQSSKRVLGSQKQQKFDSFFVYLCVEGWGTREKSYSDMGDPLRWRKQIGLAGLVTRRIALLFLVLQLCSGRVDGLEDSLREGRGERLPRLQTILTWSS